MKKPTLEEVKEYFKDAKTVECLFNGEKCDITKNIVEDIHSGAGGGYWITISTHKGGGVGLWSAEKGYAEIITKKEPTYQITKETILKYNMKDEFPDVFEVKLEAGKWYKTFHYNGECLFLFNGGFDEENNPKGYGFDSNNKFHEVENSGWGFHNNNHGIATHQEVETAFKNEAVKRYKVGDYIFDGWSKIQANIERLDKFDFSYNTLFVLNNNNSKTALFCDGTWATVIPTKTIKEAEDLLKDLGHGCKIVKL